LKSFFRTLATLAAQAGTIAAVACTVVACSGKTTSNSSVESSAIDGTFGGHVIIPQSTVAGTVSSGSFDGAQITLTTLTNACQLVGTGVGANYAVHGSQSLSLSLLTNTPLAPGAFPITSSSSATTGAVAVYQSFDADCVPTFEFGVSGTVRLDTLTASEMTGTFDVVFGTSATAGDAGTTDHVTGSFVAPICQAIDSELGNLDAAIPACM
jgi:hypothetical protein